MESEMFSGEIIDKNTPVPMYFQLKNIILKEIEAGRLKPGDYIPTETELREQFDISRTTVRQAITELVMEGYLERDKGRGTFVSRPKMEQKFMQSIISYAEEMRLLGFVPKTEILEMKVIPASEREEARQKLCIPEDGEIIYIKRLRYASDEPMVVDEVCLSTACAALLDIGPDQIAEYGLYHFLFQKNETKVMHVTRQIESVACGKKVSELLGIPKGAPVQLTTTLSYNKDEVPLEYTVAHYRGDKTKFRVDLFNT